MSNWQMVNAPARKKYRRYRRRQRRYRARETDNWMWLASKAWSGVKMLKNLINVEFKFKDANSATTASTTAVLTLLNGLQKGDDVNTRDGRQVRFKSIEYRDFLQIHQSATNTLVRVMLVLDTGPDGAVPAWTDIVQTNSTNAFRNLNFRKRFIILKDFTRTLSITGTQKFAGKFYKRLDFKTVYDDGDAGTIADINSNALYLVYISDEVTNVPNYNYNVRLRFIDN